MVAALVLPVLLAALGDAVNGRIALWRSGLAGGPVDGAFDGRDERQGAAPGYGRAGRFAVVGAIAANYFHFRLRGQLLEQLGQDAGIIDVAMRHQDSAYLAHFRIQRQMHFTPAAPLAVAVLVHFPFALAKEQRA